MYYKYLGEPGSISSLRAKSARLPLPLKRQSDDIPRPGQFLQIGVIKLDTCCQILYYLCVSRSDRDFGHEHRSTFPKYSISVVTVITGVQPHTLRHYERSGLLSPARTEGRTRRYSDEDLELIREVARLAALGINYAGIKEVLRLRAQWYAMKDWPGIEDE